jgi:hypothetical protein
MRFRPILAFLAPLFVAAALHAAPAASDLTEQLYLSGRDADHTVDWDFLCSAGQNSGFWSKIAVPSCWELKGFGTYNYGVTLRGKPAGHPAIAAEQGRYRHRFVVPETWKGRTIRLVFEGSMTDTEVWLNEKSAGPLHQGAFYRFKYDVTELVKYGRENVLEVTVSKESANPSVNEAERRGDYWNFGGIFRPVYLESLPERFIEHCAIDAQANGSFRAEIELGHAFEKGEAVSVLLLDPKGEPVTAPIGAEAASGANKVVVSTHLDGVLTWSAETPRLYKAVLSLSKEGKLSHQIEQRFGFRTFEIRKGDGFYLNGRKITLKGANRHCFWADTGRALSPRIDQDDLRLMRGMNMNAVRCSHYPPDESFLDLCDELGLYVLDELGGWHGLYDTEVGAALLRAMVRKDGNHPSVIIWDNGNEGGWNVELDDLFPAVDIQKRPVLHPLGSFSGVNTFHYRSYAETQEFLKGPEVFFPTEFLHGLYDGGLGAGLFDYWELMRKSPLSAGGLLWVYADEGVVRSDQNGRVDNAGSYGPDGIVGPRHEKEGSYYTIREVWSPVVVTDATLPDSFDGTLHVDNRYDFIDLSQCSFRWSLARFPSPLEDKDGHATLAEEKMAGPQLAPGKSGNLKLELPADWREADALYLTAVDPSGEALWTWSWSWKKSADLLRLPSLGLSPKTRDDGIYLSASAGSLDLRLDKETGLLDSIYVSGKPIPFAKGPRFVACRRANRDEKGAPIAGLAKGQDRVYVEISDSPKLVSLTHREENGAVVLEACYDGFLRKASWRLDGSGTVRLDYEYAYEGVVDLIGVGFQFPENHVQSLRWLGKGPYRSWQNRTHGTTLDVWRNAYNDVIPGESFGYPEFKGFFQAWRWARFGTVDGDIILGSESGETYLGVYSPRDGKDALLYTFPQYGITVLDVIPPVRNKVNATELIGPQSQPKLCSGVRKGTLYLRFEGRK